MEKRYDIPEEKKEMASEPATAGYRQRTVFSAAQVELLNAMSYLKTDEEIRQLQMAITKFFAQRADEEMEKLWESGKWNEQTLEELKQAHYRTPYKK